MFWILIGIIVPLCLLYNYIICNEGARLIYKVPGPKKYFIFGNALTVLKTSVDMMKSFRVFAKMYNGIYSIWICPYGAVVIYNLEDVEKILSSRKYAEKSILYSLLKPWLGEGLLISQVWCRAVGTSGRPRAHLPNAEARHTGNGRDTKRRDSTKWQERRKILTPAFHLDILRQFFDIINENSELLIDKLKDNNCKTVDVMAVISEFTLNTICETAMGTKLREDFRNSSKSYKKAVHNLGLIIIKRLLTFYLYPDFIFNLSSYGRFQRKCLKNLHYFTESVIEQRKDYRDKIVLNNTEVVNNGLNTHTYKKNMRAVMLDLLLSAHEKGLIDREGIREEVDTFMFEGHDTTASGLTFCLMVIANHKEIQNKIRDELTKILGNSNLTITIEDLNQMKYMECCIKESLRMYPPVPMISRNLDEPTVLSNYQLPSGTTCIISIIDLHYLESIYKNANKFDPDRFLPENSIGRHPYAYIPFSAGPRNCIGQKFAMMEMKIVLANILREFDLLPVTRPDDICLTTDMILKNNGPVLVKFVKRKQIY